MSNISVSVKGPKEPQMKESLIPAATTLKRGLAVIYGTDEYLAGLASTLGGAIQGVVEEDAVSTELPVSVIEFGPAIVQIGAAVSAGDFLSVNAAGQFITAASTYQIVGRALSGNSNAGDFITANIAPCGAVKA
jgi:hypothetical protein